jgi:hypothetical protein
LSFLGARRIHYLHNGVDYDYDYEYIYTMSETITTTKGPSMKTERDYGYEFAELIQATDQVIISEIAGSTSKIPAFDYVAMLQAGIENPDLRAYWAGFNAYVSE